jgi:hypothetical protein
MKHASLPLPAIFAAVHESGCGPKRTSLEVDACRRSTKLDLPIVKAVS